MIKKQSKVTKAGAVALEENQLDDAQGGVIAIAPSTGILIGQTAIGTVAHKDASTVAVNLAPKWKI